jgi:tRNA-2-methylthio-N6-dimethylallyladenosine synthase
MIRFFVRTFGCQMNESDSERIAGILAGLGGTPVDRPEDADIVLVNTCAVRAKSEDKLFSYLGRLGRLKEKKTLRLGVVGCVAQLRGLELLGRKSPVDFVLGPDNYDELPVIIGSSPSEKTACTDWSAGWHKTAPDAVVRQSPVSAYVTVMEGCDNFCAYCVVPFTRGREKYRPRPSVLGEVGDLARRGYREVQLLGQNVNSYRDPETGMTLAGLLGEVAAAGIPWVRFLTSHPKNWPLEIGEVMSERRTVCRQLHLPLQSGSSAVLKRMKRGYTRTVSRDHRRAPAPAAGDRAEHGHHRRLSGRDRTGIRGDPRGPEDGPVHQPLLLPVFAAPADPGRRAPGRYPPGGKAAPPDRRPGSPKGDPGRSQRPLGRPR